MKCVLNISVETSSRLYYEACSLFQSTESDRKKLHPPPLINIHTVPVHNRPSLNQWLNHKCFILRDEEERSSVIQRGRGMDQMTAIRLHYQLSDKRDSSARSLGLRRWPLRNPGRFFICHLWIKRGKTYCTLFRSIRSIQSGSCSLTTCQQVRVSCLWEGFIAPSEKNDSMMFFIQAAFILCMKRKKKYSDSESTALRS